MAAAACPHTRASDSTTVFNEVMYHPATATGTEEWIELANLMAVDMDLSGWRLAGGVSFTFPDGTRLAAGGHVVVAGVPAAVPGSLGPWTGRLANGGEVIRLLSASGRIMDVFEYGDNHPWPNGPDGSGATLARRRAGAADRGAEAWTGSREIGGTPGAPNFPDGPLAPGVRISEISAAGEAEFRVELVNEASTPVDLASLRLGSSSLPAGTLSPGAYLVVAESTLGFRPADGSRLFLFGDNGAALLDAVTVRATGRARGHGRMMVPSAPTFGGANIFDLTTDVVINEIMFRSPPFPSREGVEAVVESSVVLPLDAIWRYRGDNVDLGASWAATSHPIGGPWRQGAALLGFETTPDALPDLLRTPFPSSNAATYYFETDFTLTATQVATAELLRLEHVIDDGAVFYINGIEVKEWRFNLPDGPITHSTLASGGVVNAALRLAIDTPAAGLKLVAGTNRLSIQVHQQIATGNDMICGARLSLATTVAPAVLSAPVTSNPEEWIELHNRGATEIDLSGWSVADGIRFTVPDGVRIAPGGFLVIANDQATLQSKWPEHATRIIGDFSGNLSNDGERIELRDARGNLADEARYLPSTYSDGGGSSLELRDPRSDNSLPAAWTDSDETAKGEWRTFTWQAPATQRFGPTTWNELRLGMLEAGECLIDDLRVIRDPDGAAVDVMRNGSFETTPLGAHWRFLGNHSASAIIPDPDAPTGHVLHFKGHGPTETNHNHAESTFVNNSRLTSGLHEVSFRARWLAGTNQLNVRAYYQKLAKTVELPIPARLGTPGAPNSRAVANEAPVLTDLQHAPAVPAANTPVTVSCRATDPDGVATAIAHYRLNGAATFTTIPMALADGRWSATLPTQPAGAIVQFYVTATDAAGASSLLPSRGPDSRALIQWQDAQNSARPAHQLRIIMLTADRTFLLNTFNLLSNDRVPGTLIYRGQEVFHDVGVRLKGTAAARARDGNDYIGYDVAFPPDRLFRGVHASVGIDRSARAPVVRRQDEIYVRHTFNRAGLPCPVDDLCYLIAPNTVHTGTAILQLASYGGLWVDSQFEETTGTVYNWDITYDPSTTSSPGNPESLKPPTPFGHVGTDFANFGTDKEQYRGPFDIRAGKRRDEFGGLIRLAQTMILPSTQLAVEAPKVLDLDQVFACTALVNLWGIGDSYYTGGLHHNIRLFVPDSGRGVNFLPWDMDFAMTGSTSAPLFPSGNTLGRLITSSPGHRRHFLGHIHHLCNTVFNTTYLGPWLTHYGSVLGQNFNGSSSYINARRTYAQSQLPAQTAFAITTENGADFSTSEPEIVLEGTGWVDIKEIRRENLPLELTWLNLTRWRAALPLTPGANTITLNAIGYGGDSLEARTLTITSTAPPEPLPRDFLRITEIHYHPAEPATPAETAASNDDNDFEFLEIRNIGPAPLKIDGVRFTQGIDLTVAAGTTLAAGQFAVVVRHRSAFEARYGRQPTVIGEYGPSSLSNSGETISLVDATGAVIQSFDFSDTWIPETDGGGLSLAVVDESAATPDLGTPAAWTASRQRHGNPGTSNTANADTGFGTWQTAHFTETDLANPAVSGPDADPNGTGITHFFRYATGRSPGDTHRSPLPDIHHGDGTLHLDIRRRHAAPDLEWSLETAASLNAWTPTGATPVTLETHNDGTETVRWTIPIHPDTRFGRIRVIRK